MTRRRHRSISRLRADRPAVLALGFLIVLAVVAIFRGLVVPGDPYDQNLTRAFEGPSTDFWLGTDSKGRDVLSRLVFATRIAVLAAAEAVGLALLLGAVPGVVAGHIGRATDAIISRAFDSLMALPGVVLALAVVGVLGPGVNNAMIAIGILLAPTFFRIARGGARSVTHETFIEAARATGAPATRILRRHIVPNVAAPIIVQASVAVGVAILAESGLSFLGLGVQPPEPSWGSMLDDAFNNFYRSGVHVVPPIAMIVATILACSVLADGLRDATGRPLPTR